MPTSLLLPLLTSLALGGAAAGADGSCPHHSAKAESEQTAQRHDGAGCPHHAAGEAHAEDAEHHAGCPCLGAEEADAEPHAGGPHHGGAAHAGHHATASDPHGVDARGDREMGFSHARTRHHFRLQPAGGTIEVEVVDPADGESLAAVRSHLAEIARLFAAGDFAKPAAIHDREVPGTDALIVLRAEITYRYQDTPQGGKVAIATENSRALAALHEFLRFQIADHRTGDPLTVSP